MPRTFKATVALITVLTAVAVLTFINVIQTNSAENSVLELRQKVDALQESNARIADQLKQGVSVAGGGQRGGQAAADADKYAAALEDPENILHKATDLVVPPDAKFGGTLRRVAGDTPKGYNWITENSVDVSNIQEIVHAKFARRDFNNPDNFVPDLAYKVTVNDDYTEYTIHIREGVYWHTPKVDFSDPKNEWLKEPRELTAEDCVFYFELVQNPQVEAGALKNYYEDMESAEVVDRYTFKVKWKKKVYQSMWASIETYPMPKWLFTKNEQGEEIPKETLGLKFNSHWASNLALGVGPYEHIETKSGQFIKLQRFDKYFGQEYPIQEIEYLIIKDPEAAYLKLQADEMDFLGSVPPPRYKDDILEGKNTPFTRGELEYRVVDRFAYYYLGWNAERPFFEDVKVRKAMTHAVNRTGLIKSVFHGLGTIQTGPFYYKHPATDPGVVPYDYDLDKASALLDEAGWKDTDGDGIRDKMVDGESVPFKFGILGYANSPVWQSVLSVFKEELRKIGVIMTPQFVDWPTMQKKMNEKKFDAFTGGWGLGWTIDPYQIWHSSQADVPKGSNRVAFKNERADEIIEELRVTFDEAKRIELAHEFHRLLHELQPYTFLFSPQSVPAWQPRLENVVINSIRPQFHSLPWYIDPSVEKAPEKK